MEVLKSRPDIISFVENIAAEQGIENGAITKVKTNEKGEGFLGQIFMVTVKNPHGKELNVVVKAAFVEERQRAAPIKISFLNEINFYTLVEPIFRKLELDHGLSHTDFFPKCYKVHADNDKELLGLEDLKITDFEPFSKKKVLDEEHVTLIFKTYGRFHGYFYALKDQQPEEYAKLAGKFYNVYDALVTKPDEGFKKYIHYLSDSVVSCLVPGEDDEIIKKYEKYRGDGLVERFHEIVKENVDYSTILHGDCWSNNMMFKYEKVDSGRRLTDLRLIDLQLTKQGSPACDLAYCLYSGGSKELYDNLDKYLRIYHDSLSATLKEFGSDVGKVFPFHILKEHWRKSAAFGITMGVMIVKMKLTEQEDIYDLTDEVDRIDVTKIRFDELEFKKRVRELLHHLSEIDAL